MNHSILPEDLEQDIIYRMQPGDVGYTLHWAIQADEYRRLWIRGDYPVEARPDPNGVGGTDRYVKIERTRDGVIVYRDTLSPSAKYEPSHMMMSAWLPLPVELR